MSGNSLCLQIGKSFFDALMALLHRFALEKLFSKYIIYQVT